MPNQITVNGLEIQTLPEIIAELLNGAPGFLGYYQIYGPDINVDQNSPDGQTINLYALGKEDTLQLDLQIYTSMDPDEAIGSTLDARCAFNGVVRKAGTPTTQLVAVTTSQALTLAGLDTAPDAPFIVQDQSANRFALLTTTVFSGASTQNLNFQALKIGAFVVQPNTLTVIGTPQLGVTGVTNASLAGVTGINNETDAALRIRRQQSVAQPSRGYVAGLTAALLAIDGVPFAKVYENDTGSTDGDGIPGHSIWVVVDCANTTALKAAVAQAIYTQKSMGCGMKGAVTVNVTQVDGSIFVVKFDFATPEPLWFKATLTAISGTVPSDLNAQILAQFGNAFDIGQDADASAISAFIKLVAPNVSVSVIGVSADGVTYVPLLAPTTIDAQFEIPDLAHIVLT